MKPIDFRIQPAMVSLVEQIMDDTGALDPSQVLNEALSLLSWAVSESKDRHKIASIDESARSYTLISMRALQVAASRSLPRPVLTVVPKGDSA